MLEYFFLIFAQSHFPIGVIFPGRTENRQSERKEISLDWLILFTLMIDGQRCPKPRDESEYKQNIIKGSQCLCCMGKGCARM
ncbi:hypothetical protein L1887_22805 [Cichorium endivia]|nr:hypothetical protein L1887_22805 [Cichorium endivia]